MAGVGGESSGIHMKTSTRGGAPGASKSGTKQAVGEGAEGIKSAKGARQEVDAVRISLQIVASSRRGETRVVIIPNWCEKAPKKTLGSERKK